MNRAAVHVVSLVARWGARLAGVLMIGLFLLIAIGESVSNGPPPLRVFLSPYMLGMLTAMAGMVIGWRRERLGAAIVITACVAMNTFHWVVYHRWLGGAFPLFLAPGVLLLISHYLNRPSMCSADSANPGVGSPAGLSPSRPGEQSG